MKDKKTAVLSKVDKITFMPEAVFYCFGFNTVDNKTATLVLVCKSLKQFDINPIQLIKSDTTILLYRLFTKPTIRLCANHLFPATYFDIFPVARFLIALPNHEAYATSNIKVLTQDEIKRLEDVTAVDISRYKAYIGVTNTFSFWYGLSAGMILSIETYSIAAPKCISYYRAVDDPMPIGTNNRIVGSASDIHVMVAQISRKVFVAAKQVQRDEEEDFNEDEASVDEVEEDEEMDEPDLITADDLIDDDDDDEMDDEIDEDL